MIYQLILNGVEPIPEDEAVSRMTHPSRGEITGVLREGGSVIVHRGPGQESDILYGAPGTVFDAIAKAADLRAYLHDTRRVDGRESAWEMWRRPIDPLTQGV